MYSTEKIELGVLCRIVSNIEMSDKVYPIHFENCKFLQKSVGEIENVTTGSFTDITNVFVQNSKLYYEQYNSDTRETDIVEFDYYKNLNICKFCLKKIEKALKNIL